MKSKIWRLNKKDAGKSVTLLLISSVVSTLWASYNEGNLPSDFNSLVHVLKPAILATGSYVFHNFIRNSKDQLLTKEPKEN